MSMSCGETTESSKLVTFGRLRGHSRPFSGRGIGHFLDGISGFVGFEVGFEVAGNGMNYAHGTGSILIFYLVNGKDIKWSRHDGINNSSEIISGILDPAPPGRTLLHHGTIS